MHFCICRYFSNSEDSRPEFPAVIYSSDDVNHPHLGRHGQPCESHHLHLKTRERWLTDSPYHHHHHHNFSYINNHIDKYESLPESNHFHNGVLTIDEPKHVQSRVTTTTGNNRGKTKQKRASGDYYDKRKTTCMLYLQADHLFYEKMGRSEEACIEVMTRHVQRVNSIYRAVGRLSSKIPLDKIAKKSFYSSLRFKGEESQSIYFDFLENPFKRQKWIYFLVQHLQSL